MRANCASNLPHRLGADSRRLPFVKEIADALKKKKNGMFNKGEQWVPVNNRKGEKDWVQIGKKGKTLGKSYRAQHKGKYPKWGDSKDQKKMKKHFCYVTTIKKARKARKPVDVN